MLESPLWCVRPISIVDIRKKKLAEKIFFRFYKIPCAKCKSGHQSSAGDLKAALLRAFLICEGAHLKNICLT